jgi:NADPH:quinone reductase-like Zn-dependent oxidoreductase
MLKFWANDVGLPQVCALLNGGGYAEKVVVPAGLLLPVPEGVSLTDAAGLAEVACTVWSTVFMTSHLSPGESFLVRNLSCSSVLHAMIAICKLWYCNSVALLLSANGIIYRSQALSQTSSGTTN